jgi:uncharacterized Zn finger protein (UPF0148 family)
MGESLTTQLLHSDLEVNCPRCGYPLWVQYAEVVVQSAVLCPCCRVRIWLHDAQGSIQNAGETIEQQINQALKGLFK